MSQSSLHTRRSIRHRRQGQRRSARGCEPRSWFARPGRGRGSSLRRDRHRHLFRDESPSRSYRSESGPWHRFESEFVGGPEFPWLGGRLALFGPAGVRSALALNAAVTTNIENGHAVADFAVSICSKNGRSALVDLLARTQNVAVSPIRHASKSTVQICDGHAGQLPAWTERTRLSVISAEYLLSIQFERTGVSARHVSL